MSRINYVFLHNGGYMNTLGERIKQVRTMRKRTQVQFAKELGISQTHVSKIEKGVEHPSEMLLLFIAQKYNINAEWIKNGIGKPEIELGSGHEDYIHHFKEISDSFENKLNTMVIDEVWNSVDAFNYLYQIIKNYSNNEDIEKSIKALEKINAIMSALFNLSMQGNDADVLESKIKQNKLATKINENLLELLNI